MLYNPKILHLFSDTIKFLIPLLPVIGIDFKKTANHYTAKTSIQQALF